MIPLHLYITFLFNDAIRTMNPLIEKANKEGFTYIKGERIGQNYRFYDNMYAVVDSDRNFPLSCVSIANNSLSIDLWTGCSFQCAYCHVQGIQEELDRIEVMVWKLFTLIWKMEN